MGENRSKRTLNQQNNNNLNPRDLIFNEDKVLRRMIGSILPSLKGIIDQSEPFKSFEVKRILNLYGKEYPLYSSYSCMNDVFHPAPFPDFLSGKNLQNEIVWVSKKGKLDFPSEHTPKAIREWTDTISKLLGVVKITGYIKTSDKKEETKKQVDSIRFLNRRNMCPKQVSRETCRAHFELIPHRQLDKNSPFNYYPDRNRAIKLLAKLYGRLYNWEDPWLTANTLPIAKIGLVPLLADKFVEELSGSWTSFAKDFPGTYSLLICCCSVFSERKAFTLDSQKQGGLNKYMEMLLQHVKVREKSGFKILALFLPVVEVFSEVSKNDANMIYQTSMEWLNHIAPFLESQWKKGVSNCVKRNCLVPPRGSKVNSAGYNAAADCWMNLRRFQTISGKFAEIEDIPPVLKVMQLIAGDQYRWGNGVIDPNALVYKEITSSGVLPWEAILYPESFDRLKAVTSVIRSVNNHGSSIDSWLGIAKLRQSKVSKPVDMICGVPVENFQEDDFNFLKNLGVFGATPWKGK